MCDLIHKIKWEVFVMCYRKKGILFQGGVIHVLGESFFINICFIIAVRISICTEQ